MTKKPDKTPLKTQSPTASAKQLNIMTMPGKTDAETMAYSTMLPHVRHAHTIGNWAGRMFPEGQPAIQESVNIVTEQCDRVRGEDISAQTDMLVTQAMTLDAVFTDMLGRASSNLGQYPDAVERYMRLAFKAQAQSRASIEALGKIVRGGEQVVRHIHVDNRGGQAVITEAVHSGGGNAYIDDQSQGPDAAAPVGPALLGQDAPGITLPVPGDARPEKVSHTRRREPRSAARK